MHARVPHFIFGRLGLAGVSLFSFVLVAGCKGGETSADMGGATDDMSVAMPDLSMPGGGDMAKPPTCGNGVKDGRESDVDCGGDCPPCALGKACGGNADCETGLCSNGVCANAGCKDGVQNGDETDVDCGGSCPTPCRPGQSCQSDKDCSSIICNNKFCEPPSCSDGIKNGSETDVDCGGGACRQCIAGQACVRDGDCATGLCDVNTNVCIGCNDGKQNGTESDVDCGGRLCVGCANGLKCLQNNDCASRLCRNGACTACVADADCPFLSCKMGVCSSAQLVGALSGQNFYKVQVMGAMTDTNVFNACKAAGLTVPCQAPVGCPYTDNLCRATQERICGQPMAGLASAVCNGQLPSNCPALYGCYQYMAHNFGKMDDSAAGAEMGRWPVAGAYVMNEYALCVN